MADEQLLNMQCSYCRGSGTRLCTGCEVVRYDSVEHQTAHWPIHKSQCTVVKKSRTQMEKEERKLRDHPGDLMTPANPFSQPGHFWGWVGTRPYMRARYILLDNIRKIKTVEAVQAALGHAMSMHELSRGDNMAWHGTTGQNARYDWGNMNLPYLDLKNEDVFEGIEVMIWNALSHQVSLTLIKLRLLLGLHRLQKAVSAGSALTQENVDRMLQGLASSTILKNQRIMQDVKDGRDLTPHMERVKKQLAMLFTNVTKTNKYFWPALVDPGEDLTAEAAPYTMGSREEMQLILQSNYEAWQETPGAIQWVKARL